MSRKSTFRSRRARPSAERPATAERGSLPDRQEMNPPNPDRLPDFRFFAVAKSWMEEDVVEATVKNAFAQGVERVFLVGRRWPPETMPTTYGFDMPSLRRHTVFTNDCPFPRGNGQ